MRCGIRIAGISSLLASPEADPSEKENVYMADVAAPISVAAPSLSKEAQPQTEHNLRTMKGKPYFNMPKILLHPGYRVHPAEIIPTRQKIHYPTVEAFRNAAATGYHLQTGYTPIRIIDDAACCK